MEEKQKKKNTYNKLVIDKISNLIDKRIENIKYGLPLILTVITALIGFLFLQQYESKNVFYFAMIVMIFLILSFISILMVLIPKVKYNDTPEKNKFERLEFNPLDIRTYLYLDEKIFIDKLSEYLQCEFSKEELFEIKSLKQSINEYRFKKSKIEIAYKILIGGAVILCVLFCLGLFMM